eukprot:SAG22_NODE_487_length_9870_cov_13.118821_11_plen_99_part_00
MYWFMSIYMAVWLLPRMPGVPRGDAAAEYLAQSGPAGAAAGMALDEDGVSAPRPRFGSIPVVIAAARPPPPPPPPILPAPPSSRVLCRVLWLDYVIMI